MMKLVEHAGLKSRCRKACGFESLSGHYGSNKLTGRPCDVMFNKHKRNESGFNSHLLP